MSMTVIGDTDVTMDLDTYHKMTTDANRWRFTSKALKEENSPQRAFMESIEERADQPPDDVSADDHLDFFVKCVDEGIEKVGL